MNREEILKNFESWSEEQIVWVVHKNKNYFLLKNKALEFIKKKWWKD